MPYIFDKDSFKLIACTIQKNFTRFVSSPKTNASELCAHGDSTGNTTNREIKRFAVDLFD